MKHGNFSSEQNGISLAVDVGTEKPIYCSPAQFEGLLERIDSLRKQFSEIPRELLSGINERAGLTPEARKAARVTAQRTKLEAALAACQPGSPQYDVAEMELKLFSLKNS